MEYIIIFIFLLILSAFFSGTETAYFHIRKHRKETPEKIKSVLDSPQRLLVSLLTGNTIVNVSIASLAAYITAGFADDYTWSKSTLILMEVLVVSVVVLIFGEILPKMIAIKYSKEYALKMYTPLKIMMFILSPIAQGFNAITNVVIKIIPFRKEKIFDSEEELKILAELGEEEGTLQEEESDMIQSIFDFKEKTVGEIITPRVDIVSLKSDESIDKAMDIIGERQFSKIPIYKDTIDNIKGILYAKDIIPYLMGSRPNVNLQTLARQPFFVPETKPIDDLMEEFKLRKTSIAIVVDEWGGTEGLVTLEDVVEEVMGEIRDPYDQEESNVLKQSDGSFIVDGSITIYDLEEETDIEFPEDRDYDTLGGFILDILTDIPQTGEQVEFNDMVFTVQTVENNRIGKIKIQINS
ncbi:MAG: hemolysin family protein [Candidatus Marinimicrobia bacterium]|nr:hemolysin family protein [Candidatus Neomarinimicrobiota bacterium]HIB14214.1 HlyC/CorC family transporter [Candidatus Neomarinimicrobiota bacterium]